MTRWVGPPSGDCRPPRDATTDRRVPPWQKLNRVTTVTRPTSQRLPPQVLVNRDFQPSRHALLSAVECIKVQGVLSRRGETTNGTMQDPTVRNITFATPAPDEPAHEQTNKEIKLWDRSAVPLGTRTSVSHADYRQMPIEPPPPSQRLGYTPNPHKLDARTTTQDAYQAWAPQAPPSPSMGPGYTPSKHKFNGTSVSHDDYRQMPIEPPPPSQRLSYTPNPHKLDGFTTTQDAYRAITVPQGSQALGVRTQGGGFHPLIPAGSTLPAIGSAVFTTTSRNQSEVASRSWRRVRPPPL